MHFMHVIFGRLTATTYARVRSENQLFIVMLFSIGTLMHSIMLPVHDYTHAFNPVIIK